MRIKSLFLFACFACFAGSAFAQLPLRIAADSAVRKSAYVPDLNNNSASLSFVRGDDVTIETGLFENGRFLTNLSSYTNLACQIFYSQNSPNGPLMAQSITNTNASPWWNTNCSYGGWISNNLPDTNWQAEFYFPGAQTSVPLNGQPSQTYWMRLAALTTNNHTVTFLEGPVTIYDGPISPDYLAPAFPFALAVDQFVDLYPPQTNFFAANSNLLNQSVNNNHGTGGGGSGTAGSNIVSASSALNLSPAITNQATIEFAANGPNTNLLFHLGGKSGAAGFAPGPSNLFSIEGEAATNKFGGGSARFKDTNGNWVTIIDSQGGVGVGTTNQAGAGNVIATNNITASNALYAAFVHALASVTNLMDAPSTNIVKNPQTLTVDSLTGLPAFIVAGLDDTNHLVGGAVGFSNVLQLLTNLFVGQTNFASQVVATNGVTATNSQGFTKISTNSIVQAGASGSSASLTDGALALSGSASVTGTITSLGGVSSLIDTSTGATYSYAGSTLSRFTNVWESSPAGWSTPSAISAAAGTFTSVSASGTITGNGAGLTNVNPATVFSSGTIQTSNLPATLSNFVTVATAASLPWADYFGDEFRMNYYSVNGSAGDGASNALSVDAYGSVAVLGDLTVTGVKYKTGSGFPLTLKDSPNGSETLHLVTAYTNDAIADVDGSGTYRWEISADGTVGVWQYRQRWDRANTNYIFTTNGSGVICTPTNGNMTVKVRNLTNTGGSAYWLTNRGWYDKGLIAPATVEYRVKHEGTNAQNLVTFSTTNADNITVGGVTASSYNVPYGSTATFICPDGTNIFGWLSYPVGGVLPVADASLLTNLQGNAGSNGWPVVTSAQTNWNVTPDAPTKWVILTNNAGFDSISGGPGSVTFYLAWDNTNRNITWPTNWPTSNTNQLTLSGTNWLYVLSNSMTLSFAWASNMTSVLQLGQSNAMLNWSHQ